MSNKKYSVPFMLLGYTCAVLAAISITVSIPHTIPYTERANALLQAIVKWAGVNGIPILQVDPWNVTYNDGWSQPVVVDMGPNPNCSYNCGTNTYILRALPQDAKWTNPTPSPASGSGGSASTGGSAGYSITITGHWVYGSTNSGDGYGVVSSLWVLDSISVPPPQDPGNSNGKMKAH
jgi:hypothetical protein